MQYLLLGLAALLLFLIAARAYTGANPQVLVRQLRIGVGVAALTGGGFFLLRGMFLYAIGLVGLGLLLLLNLKGYLSGAPWDAQSGTTATGRAKFTRVMTEYLEVELDHDTGNIRGRVLKGAFAGRRLEELVPAELARLWQDCRFADPQSAQVVEAYLDRVHPTWRDDMERAEGESPPGPTNGAMTRAQALDILGLKEGASEEDIRRAHRELMLKLHPDRGGSTFLAAKINQAKDVLL